MQKGLHCPIQVKKKQKKNIYFFLICIYYYYNYYYAFGRLLHPKQLIQSVYALSVDWTHNADVASWCCGLLNMTVNILFPLNSLLIKNCLYNTVQKFGTEILLLSKDALKWSAWKY